MKNNSKSISRLTKKKEQDLLDLIGKEQLLYSLERMYVIRAFEEKAEPPGRGADY